MQIAISKWVVRTVRLLDTFQNVIFNTEFNFKRQELYTALLFYFLKYHYKQQLSLSSDTDPHIQINNYKKHDPEVNF